MSSNLTLNTPSISAAEWEIMRVVWAEPAITSRQIINTMLTLSEWKEGTIKSMLNRLIQKGALVQDTSITPYLYSANLSGREATVARLNEICQSTCNKDHGDLVMHLIQTNSFSKTQIQDLIEQLNSQLATAPESVPCDCPIGQCHCHLDQH